MSEQGMPILLSDKEYLDYLVENELLVEIILNNNLHNRKAQLKKVVEWMEEHRVACADCGIGCHVSIEEVQALKKEAG